jgi:3-phenylpropionate/trans-cinnamate dioxygenase ferredoxin reductase subunit
VADRTFVIVGAGLCGATAAATLRDEGFDGEIVLLGDEGLPPYERPPMSKEYLRGERGFDEALVRPEDWYAEHRIQARWDAHVDALDLDAREVELNGGERIGYDALLLATGGRNRRLDVEGIGLEGVMDLRRRADADRIREAADRSSRAVLIGMGFIGCEVAAALRHLGVDVTAVEPFETPLQRVLGPEIGRAIEGLHRDHGVELLLGDSLDRFEGNDRVEAVVTKEGKRLSCDFAVVGVGTVPNVELAEAAGLAAGPRGIEVDAACRTSAPDVFAAGDVANHDHPVFGRIRVEHFDNAIRMGEAAARSMLGRAETFDDPHWFWSDQYDANLQMAGFATEWDRMVVRGSIEDRSFAAFLLHGGVLRSTVSLNWKRDVRRSMPLIRAQARPDPAKLADPEVDLRSLRPAEG